MAEAVTETASTEAAPPPAASKSGADYGKEFAKPTGKEDGAIWEKHFGKGKAEGKEERKTGKSASDSSEHSSSKDSKQPATRSERSSKDSSASTSERSERSTKAAKETPSPTDSSKSPDTKSTSKSEKSEPDKSKAETTEPAEPEPKEPGKAKDLYRKAQDEKDPKAARKLYREAMVEAFGEVPREFDESQWAVARKKQAEAEATIARGKKETEDRIADAVKQLQPAIYVMRKLNDAGVGSLSMPMVERAVSVMQAIKDVEDGDYTRLGDVIAKAAGKAPDEAMKLYVKGVKVSPEGRAARQAAERAEAEARAAQEKLAALERRLAEQEQEKSKAQQEAELEQKRAQYLDRIESDLDGHPVLKLPRGRERVLAYLIKTANRTLKAPRYTFEEAADRVVAHEKKRLRELSSALGEEREPTEPETPRGKTPVRAVPRSEAGGEGVKDESAEARFSRIYDKHSASGGRKR